MAEDTYLTRTFNMMNISSSFKQLAKPVNYIASKIADYAVNKFDNWFYFHEVLGQHGKTIYAMKFRTMTKEANKHLRKRLEENGFDKLGKPNDDDYIMPRRGWMRRWFVDEIPQIFWNILIQGDMRLVGERPQPADMWAKQIEDGIVTKKEMEEALQYLPGVCGIQYRHPELNSVEAKRRYRDFKKLRVGSADLSYFTGIWKNIIFRGLRSR